MLSLEVVQYKYGGSYLKPAFFTTPQRQGWNAGSGWIATDTQDSAPHLNDRYIDIPIHINGNHCAHEMHPEPRAIHRTLPPIVTSVDQELSLP
jgi:hypothetical protein